MRSWSDPRSWLSGAALAAALSVCSPAGAWVDAPPGFSRPPADDSTRLAAIPPSPTASEPPALDPSPERGVAASDAEPGSLPDSLARELSGPLFEDPRAERTISLPPGIPVPDYPLIITPSVETLIQIFTARDRERFGRWIARSGRYLDMIQRIFRARGLPEELAYTAMIESGFSPYAVSRVGAKGMWQFMEGTARRYGLTVNRWVDERLDPVRATVAAAQYLGDLYDMFGHWFLAQAAYNAGEARIAKAIQRTGTSDFWALTRTPHLPDETKLFVPQILAATVITREPARFGFDVDPAPALAYEDVPVARSLDLETVARLAGVAEERVRELNPSLVARVTPPTGEYTLRLPEGTGARFTAALEATPSGELTVWGLHRVGRSQTLAEIARLYRISPQRLTEVNHLVGGRLRGIAELIVPVSNREKTVVGSASLRPVQPVASRTPAGPREVVVRRGDTLAAIGARYGVKPHVLARLNGMDPEGRLPIGTRLRLVTP
ncbi:MAG: lytic transglycosylase [Candidatus Rokuibacteriota bacterium]|nr:MAG: lytic transglycosylase [Candidatus Rokubacteria bacterium]